MRQIDSQQFCNIHDMTVEFMKQTLQIYEPLAVSAITQRLTELNKLVASVNVTLPGTIDIAPETEVQIQLNNQLLFSGVVATPVEHKNKTTVFQINSQIESFEIGFSPEESQLDFVNQFEPWPLGFGTPKKAKAVRVRQQASTTMRTTVCLVNGELIEQRRQTLDALNQGLIVQGYWHAALDAIASPTASDTIDAYIPVLQAEDLQEQALNVARQEMFDKQKLWEEDQIDRDKFLEWEVAKASLRTLMDNLEAIVTPKFQIEEHIQFLDFFRKSKDYIGNKLLEIWRTIRDLIYQYHQIELKICQQLQCAQPQQYVNGSEFFPQNQTVRVKINGLLFDVIFDGDSMLGVGGPFNEQENITVDPWAPDDDPCSVYDFFNGIDLIRTQATGLANKWLLIRDIFGEKHIIYCKAQIDDKVYLQLVPWANDRIKKAQSQSFDTIINTIVETPLYDAFGNGINSGYYTGDLDPAVWTSRESQRYLELIGQVPNPTDDEKRNIAILAYVERYDNLNGFVIPNPSQRDIYTLIAPDVDEIEAVCGEINPAWLNGYQFYSEEVPAREDWKATPGTEVVLDTCEIYIVNILPSTVKSVQAYYTDDKRYLRDIPTRYFTIDDVDLNGITPTVLIFNRPLRENTGWEDEIYVTYESSVGPKIVDIMTHLIDTYTDKTVDTASFTAVGDIFQDKYPANFVFYDRPDALDALNRIAWEARCAVTLRDDVIHLTYLAQEPTELGNGLSTATIVEGSRELTTQSIDQLITRYNVTWTEDGVSEPKKLTLRNNIPDYQVKQQDVEILLFDQYDLVHKCINFWLMRNSNLFYTLTVEADMDAINYEIFDGMSTPYRKGRVIETSYNHATRSVFITVETPFRYQEDTEYPYYWPSQIDPSIVWPGAEDNPGGYGPGTTVSGTIPCP